MNYFYLKFYLIMLRLLVLFFPLSFFSITTIAVVEDRSEISQVCMEINHEEFSAVLTPDDLALMRSNIYIEDIVTIFGSALLLLTDEEVDKIFMRPLRRSDVHKLFQDQVRISWHKGYLNGTGLDGHCQYVELYAQKCLEEKKRITQAQYEALTCISNIFVLTKRLRFEEQCYEPSNATHFDLCLLHIINNVNFCIKKLRNSIREKIVEFPAKPRLEKSVVFAEGFYHVECEEVIDSGYDKLKTPVFLMELPVKSGTDEYVKYANMQENHFECLLDESKKDAVIGKRLDPLEPFEYMSASHAKSIVVVFGPSDSEREYNIKVGMTGLGFKRFYTNDNYAVDKNFEARILLSAKTQKDTIVTVRYFMAQLNGEPNHQDKMYTVNSSNSSKNGGNIFSFKTKRSVQPEFNDYKSVVINDKDKYTSILVCLLGGHDDNPVVDANQSDAKPSIEYFEPKEIKLPAGASEAESSGNVTKQCRVAGVQYASTTISSEVDGLRVYVYHTDQDVIEKNEDLIAEEVRAWWGGVCTDAKWTEKE